MSSSPVGYYTRRRRTTGNRLRLRDCRVNPADASSVWQRCAKCSWMQTQDFPLKTVATQQAQLAAGATPFQSSDSPKLRHKEVALAGPHLQIAAPPSSLSII